MSKPSVLLINRVYPPVRGASGWMLRDLAETFAREGWSVTVLTTGDVAEQTGDQGVIIRRVKIPQHKNLVSYLVAWIKLTFTALRMARRDLIVTLSDPPMIYLVGRAFAKIKGAKHIHWCHDLYPDLFPALGYRLPRFLQNYLMRLSRRTMKMADAVVAIGQCMARHLTQTGMDISRLQVIPNWADRDVIAPPVAMPIPVRVDVQGARPPETLIRDTSPRFRVLYAGTMGRAHPMQTVLDAAQALSMHQEIEFVFVGDSPAHERLARERDRRGLMNIKFIPFQPAPLLKPMLENADLHLITQKSETAGLLVPCKFYTAMAAARPCLYVGAPDTDIARMILESGAGVVIAPGQGDHLAETVLAYRMNKDVWETGHQAARRVASAFTPAASLAAWVKLAIKVTDKGQA